MVTFNSTKKKNTGGGNPSYVGNNQSGYSAESGSGEKNKGGVLGGLGYVGAGLAAGIGSVGEGIIDLLLAGGGLLTGNVDYAKHVFKDNTVGNWFADVTEDFNPGTGWEFWGNVTHGLGQSSVFLLNLIPGLGQLGTAAFFAGVGSQGISSAAATTGDVGFKEVAYGVASGAVEGALEKAFGGMGKAVKALGGSTMKNITKTAVRKGLVKQVLSDAAGEFGEEFASEYIDTFLQRGFQIDPNKQYSFKDALYAGAVGFTSGAVSAGSANVLKAIGNERVGDRIVKSGNSQTLVNTATKVADKLAAQGTNWDRAGEWVKALRGQVDAYNKLSENEKTSMRGKTILGEMKSSLFFAETQSTFDLVKKSIQDSDEQTRATFAEYINKSVEKGKRNGKDYTAADIAKDTDGVAWQLAIYKFVPSLFDLDGALADMQQESEIADVVAKEGGAVTAEPEMMSAANDVVGANDVAAMPQMAGARPAMQFDLDENAVNLRSDAVGVEGEQMNAGTVQDETAKASTVPTGDFEGKVDLERAKRDAERIIEWERKEAPTVDELNRVRGAVKNFDSLSGDRQRAIVRMVRSGKNIDEGVIRGVSNIMAITNKKGAVLAPDVEIRFAEFGKDSTRRGIKTEVGGKTVIVLNANATYKDTIRGTIAHEIVHYLENRKGYKALAEYAMKHAKADKVAQVRETYRKQYTIDERKANPNATEEEIAAKVDEKMRDEAAVNSEIVGNVVAELLGSEKFLKRYAQMGEEQSSVVKRIARFVKGIASSLKEKDGEASEVAADMMDLVDKALGSEVEGEKTGTKFDIDSSHDTQQKAIEENIKKVAKMSSVAKLTGKEFEKSEIDLVTQVSNFFDKQGNQAQSAELGNVTLDRRGVKDDIAHGIGRKKAASFAAVPEVVSNGKVVDYQQNWKNRGYDTAVIAAPITIDNKKHLMGIVLIKDQGNQRFYVHEVLSIEEGATPFKTGTVNNGDTGGDAPSVISILQKIASVNTSDKKSSDKEQYDLDPEAVAKKAKGKVATARAEGVLAGQISQGRKDAVKLRKAEEKLEIQKEKSQEKLESKTQELTEQKQKTKDALLAGQMSQGRKDASELRKTKEKLELTQEKLESKTQELTEQKQKTKDALLAGQMSQGAKDAVRLRKAEEKLEIQKEKSQETLAKYKKKVAVNKEKMKLRTREKVRDAKIKAEQSIREKMARENANAAKAERAKRYTKTEVAPAVEEIEALTDEQVKSLAKGFALEGMSGAQKDRIISDIYIALHEASAKGEAGPGSAAVKALATRIAWNMVQSARIKGEDGKLYHLVDIYDEASVQAIAKEYTDVLYERFANMGEHTKYSYFVADIRAAEEEFKRDKIDDNAIPKLSREVSYQGQQLRRLAEIQKRGVEDDGIQKVTKILASVVDAKGNIVTSKVDEAIGEADRFYSLQSGMADSQGQAQEGTALTEFAYSSDANLKFMIDEFKRLRARLDKYGKNRVGKFLDAQEMRLLGKILAGMRKTVTEYNKVFINEHYVDIDRVAGECATDIVEYHSLDKKAKTKVGELFNSLMRGVKQSYFYNVLTPETTIEALEGFKIGGVLKTLYHDVRIHKQKAEHLAVQMKKPFAEFLDDKKNVWTDGDGKKHSFRDKLNKKMINYNGAELTLGEAIYLYMLTKRELTHAGLKENGYIVYDENNQRRFKLKIEDVDNVRNEIGNQLDDADKAFLKMAEEFFNKTSTEVKNEADMRIFGYTNIEDGYYVPMIRDRYSRMQGVTDQRQSVGSIITVYNKSFNQNTVQNAKALEGKNIMSIINDHADGLADYSELYIPLKSFDRVYNQAVSVNGETRSIREILNDEVWNKADSYLRDLFADVQGQNRKSDNVIDSMVGKLRSAWVNSVLGLNLKVVATQTTSFVAANQVIEAKYLMPAMKKFFGNQSELGTRADQYSDIIEARSFEMGALRAQGNIDKVMEWSSKTGFMINLMDRRVCLAVFHAAELKAEAQGAGAVGTVENAKAAAKIADQAIYTTQAMTSASERSALQRSKSEIARTLSMFTSDSVKNLSHFVGNIMKYQAHKARAKSNLASKAQYEAELKKDARAIRRSAKTLVMTGVMLGLITQAFKYLYAKEEPEEKAKDLATDVISSTFNILPGVSDIIDKFVFDYDLSLNVFDVANDTIEDTASLMNTAGQAMAGEYVSGDKVFKDVINFVKTVGAAFGAPIAPVERTITGLLRRFFPSAIYGYDSMMSNPSYSADLQAAVESGDEALAEHILETIYKNEATGVYSTPELEEVARLYGLGNTSVIPQKIGATVNDVKLDRKQRAQFEKIYGEASAKVNELIRSEYYAELDDEQRAKAIKTLYSLYYNRAAAEVAGVEWSNAQAYSHLTNNYSALFAAQTYKSGLSPYKTLRGKEVSVKDQFVKYVENLGLNEADKLVVLYANGYRDAKTKKKMLAYINSLSISEEEKTRIAERLGFAIENGKIVEKKEELEVRAE